MLYISKNALKIVQGSSGAVQKDAPAKFDALLKAFIAEQSKKVKCDFHSFSNVFESFKPEVKQANLEKAKADKAVREIEQQNNRDHAGSPGIL